MKKIFRYTLLLAFALSTSNLFWKNLSFRGELITLLKVAFLLAIFELILKPIVKLLLLPVNLLTLGTFRFIIDTLGLYLAVIFIKDFGLTTINTLNSNFFGLKLPPHSFTGFFSFLVTAITLSLLLNLFNLVLSKK